MSGRIKDEDVAYIRDRAPIDEIVGEYVQLKSAGGGQKKGLCPFHDEKSPLFPRLFIFSLILYYTFNLDFIWLI